MSATEQHELLRGGQFLVKETACEDVFTLEDLSEEQKMMRDKSVIIASVVVNKAATETASIKAVLTTLVGSTIPAFTRSQNFPDWASKP